MTLNSLKRSAPAPRARLAAVCLVLMMCAGALEAADEVPGKLSVGEAINTALGTHTRVKQAEDQRLTSLSNLRIASFTTTYEVGTETLLERNAGASALPSRFFTSFTYEGLLGTTASMNIAPVGFGGRYGYVGMELRTPLMRGKGQLSEKSNLIRGAHISTDIQDKQLYLTQQYTVRDVIQAYYHAVLRREQVDVQKTALEIAEQAAEDARKREKYGLIVALDVTRAEMRVAQTKESLNRQQQSARAAMDSLMMAMGAGVGATPELTDAIPDIAVDPPNVQQSIKTALANRAELTVYDYQMADQKREIAMAKDQLRPGLDAVASFNSANTDVGWLSRSIFHQGAMNLGFEYQIPIDKRTSIEKQQTAERQLDVIKDQRDYEMEQIAEQVWNACRTLESARTSLQIQMDNLKVAQDKLDLAQRAVDEGLQDNRDVLDAQSEIANLNSGILSAKVELYLASVDLKYYMGEDLTSMGVQ